MRSLHLGHKHCIAYQALLGWMSAKSSFKSFFCTVLIGKPKNGKKETESINGKLLLTQIENVIQAMGQSHDFIITQCDCSPFSPSPKPHQKNIKACHYHDTISTAENCRNCCFFSQATVSRKSILIISLLEPSSRYHQ